MSERQGNQTNPVNVVRNVDPHYARWQGLPTLNRRQLVGGALTAAGVGLGAALVGFDVKNILDRLSAGNVSPSLPTSTDLSQEEHALHYERLGQFIGLYKIGNLFLNDLGFLPQSDPFMDNNGINIIDTLRVVAGQTPTHGADNDLTASAQLLQQLWGDELIQADNAETEYTRVQTLLNAQKVGAERIREAMYTLLTATDYHNPSGIQQFMNDLDKVDVAYSAPFAALVPGAEIQVWDGFGGLATGTTALLITSFLQNRNAAFEVIWHELTHIIQNGWRDIITLLPKQETATYLQVILEEVYTNFLNYFSPDNNWFNMRTYNFGNPVVILSGIGQSNPETTLEKVEVLEKKFEKLVNISIDDAYPNDGDNLVKQQDDQDVILRWNRLAYLVGKKYLSIRRKGPLEFLTPEETAFMSDTDTQMFLQRVSYEINHIFVDPPLEENGIGIAGTNVGLQDPNNPLTRSKLRVFNALLAAFSPLPPNQDILATMQTIRNSFGLSND